MREIKFRAWDRIQKRMFSGDEVLGPKPSIGVTVTAQSHYRLNEFFKGLSMFALDWMLFTGLRDKNGKEIYEGDILENGGVVEWVCDGWHKRVETPKGTRYYSLFRSFGEDWHKCELMCAVIGNIYQNPELLTNTERV